MRNDNEDHHETFTNSNNVNDLQNLLRNNSEMVRQLEREIESATKMSDKVANKCKVLENEVSYHISRKKKLETSTNELRKDVGKNKLLGKEAEEQVKSYKSLCLSLNDRIGKLKVTLEEAKDSHANIQNQLEQKSHLLGKTEQALDMLKKQQRQEMLQTKKKNQQAVDAVMKVKQEELDREREKSEALIRQINIARKAENQAKLQVKEIEANQKGIQKHQVHLDYSHKPKFMGYSHPIMQTGPSHSVYQVEKHGMEYGNISQHCIVKPDFGTVMTVSHNQGVQQKHFEQNREVKHQDMAQINPVQHLDSEHVHLTQQNAIKHGQVVQDQSVRHGHIVEQNLATEYKVHQKGIKFAKAQINLVPSLNDGIGKHSDLQQRERNMTRVFPEMSPKPAGVGHHTPWGMKTLLKKAIRILKHWTKQPSQETQNMKYLLGECKGIVISNVIKAGLIFGGVGGTGVVLTRIGNTWSGPLAVQISGVSFGGLLGASVTDTIMILNSDEAVEVFSNGDVVEVGGNLQVAAGNIAGVDMCSTNLHSPAYAFSYCKGAYIGVAIQGSYFSEKKHINNKFYNRKGIAAKDILGHKIVVPKTSIYNELIELLDSFYDANSKKKKTKFLTRKKKMKTRGFINSKLMTTFSYLMAIQIEMLK